MTKEEFACRAEEMKGQMYRVACAYLREEYDRLDAVQEALLKAWQGIGKLKKSEYFSTWLIRILIRECVNILRRQKRQVPLERLPEEAAPGREEQRELREAVLALPESQRIVIVLYYMEGYSVEEIRDLLRLPKGTVCSRLNRGRNQLKQYLREEEDA